jgi:transporter family-2 protein
MNAIALALAGGFALAVQNLILSAIVARGLAFPVALLLNTLVGLALLLAINLATAGPALVGNVAAAWKPWFLLPGLLGTFVVFCMVFGYSRAGATAPTVGLIAGQVLASIALDAMQVGPGSKPMSASSLLGAGLVVAGAVLVVLSRR